MTAVRLQTPKNLIGIVGEAASGKDGVASVFQSLGYQHISSSDLVREEIAGRGLETSRELQTRVANELRREHGVGFWVDKSLERADPEQEKVVISGLYSPGEGEYLIHACGGVIVGVVAAEGDDVDLRFERLQARCDGSRDAMSRQEFIEAHERETSGMAAYETNVSALLLMARFTIINSSGLEYLEEQTRGVAVQLEGVGL